MRYPEGIWHYMNERIPDELIELMPHLSGVDLKTLLAVCHTTLHERGYGNLAPFKHIVQVVYRAYLDQLDEAEIADVAEALDRLVDMGVIRRIRRENVTAFGFNFRGKNDELRIIGIDPDDNRPTEQRPDGIGVTPEARWAVWERDNFTCKRCGSHRHLSVDHIVPRSKGGRNELANYQTLCKRCNSAKGGR